MCRGRHKLQMRKWCLHQLVDRIFCEWHVCGGAWCGWTAFTCTYRGVQCIRRSYFIRMKTTHWSLPNAHCSWAKPALTTSISSHKNRVITRPTTAHEITTSIRHIRTKISKSNLFYTSHVGAPHQLSRSQQDNGCVMRFRLESMAFCFQHTSPNDA